MDFFDKAKKLSHKQSKEIAAFCGGVAVLLLIAGFVASGGTARIGQSVALNGISPSSLVASVFPCSWFSDCAFSTQVYYGLTANTTSVTSGQAVTLNWMAYHSVNAPGYGDCAQGYTATSYHNCSLTGVGAVGTPCVGGDVTTIGLDGFPYTYYDSCSNFSSNAPSGSAVVYPTTTTTYSFCGTDYWGTHDGNNYTYYPFPTPCPSVTISVAAADNCQATPNPVANGLQVPPGTFHIVAQGYDFCVTNNSGQYLFVQTNIAPSVASFYNATQGYLAGTVAYFARATGY